MTAAKTTLPVLGVPVQSHDLERPRFAAVDRADAGGRAGSHLCDRRSRAQPMRRWLAAAILANAHAPLREALDAYRERQTQAVLENSRPARHEQEMTVGIVGAGQLGPHARSGRLSLGVGLPVPGSGGASPRRAARAASAWRVHRSQACCARLARRSEVVTFDWENVSVAGAARAQERTCAICPPLAALAAVTGPGEREAPVRAPGYRDHALARGRTRARSLSAPCATSACRGC